MQRRTDSVTIEGRNMVHDAVASDQKVTSILIASTSRNDPKIRSIEDMARSKNIQVQIVDSSEIAKIAESKNPQGVIGTMELPEEISLEQLLKDKRNVNILLLNHIDYEQNLGAILRTAWAAGVDAVVATPSGVHEITPVVAKISMGGAAYVPLIGMSLFQAIKLLHKYAVPVIGVEVDAGKPYFETRLTGPTAFLMGGESEGLSEPLQKECDLFANIPMTSGVASLNVSVATALVLFEKRRQEFLIR